MPHDYLKLKIDDNRPCYKYSWKDLLYLLGILPKQFSWIKSNNKEGFLLSSAFVRGL